MKNTLRLLALVLILSSCNSGKKNTEPYSSVDKTETAAEHPGKKLMETNCYLCHSPTASETDRIGPPMIAIKKHYIDAGTTKEQFVEAMQAWIKNPNEADAKMHGAVKRFGVMPKQIYPEETIAQIAAYMYDFEIEQPDWFEDHYNQENGKGRGHGKGNVEGMRNGKAKQQNQANFEDLPYAERGLKYALSTKAVLGKNLMGTIQKKGVLEALAFCNIQAYPLTDSMALVHNASIKRVTDKPRNPNNRANAEELGYIDTFKQVIAANEEAKPIVKEFNDKVNVYYPITTNTMCIQCHGIPNTDISDDVYKKIKLLYPKDLAIDYKENEVRGIWHVKFDKKSLK
jgi:cytochrome c553